MCKILPARYLCANVNFKLCGPQIHMHKLVGLHDTVGSVRPQRDNPAVQYSLIYPLNTRNVSPPKHTRNVSPPKYTTTTAPVLSGHYFHSQAPSAAQSNPRHTGYVKSTRTPSKILTPCPTALSHAQLGLTYALQA
jgi:hypothetical protein